MDSFYIVKNGFAAAITVENSAFEGVKRIAAVVADDIFSAGGARPAVNDTLSGESAVLFATQGMNPLLEKLERSGKTDLSGIKGKREVFLIQTIDAPFEDMPQLKKLLVVAGSDKRGTIYGMFRISELCGVSPLVYFGDAAPEKKDTIEIKLEKPYISKEPSVKYRGFFINDEWPAFGNWATEKFGGINAKAYEKIFQLLLRLKGNYFWPAMWNSSFSEDGPGLANAELADCYGVIMGASHHEPMCRAGVEWQRKFREYGDDNSWSFISNADAITRFWEDGILRNKPFENVITIGMRGESDSKLMPEDATLKDNIDVIKKAILTQNALIKKHIGENVPRMLAIYKEVEDYYFGDDTCEGLKDWSELDDVIFLLSDDNFGNLRALPTEETRDHKGGYGMYYHFDYHGGPISYEWVNTNRLTKTWEQMSQAYESGVREMWIVNVGDLKGNEYPLSYFMALAYDFEGMGSSAPNKTADFAEKWVDTQFGGRLSDRQKKDMLSVINGYTKWNFIRTPESMTEGLLAPVAFRECERAADEAGALLETAERLNSELSGEALDTYHSMIYYHAAASLNLVLMYAEAGLNKELAARGLISANGYAKRVKQRIAADIRYVDAFHSTLDGKWAHCMDSAHTGFRVWDDNDWTYPVTAEVTALPCPKHAAGFRGQSEYHLGTHWGDNMVLTSEGFTRPDTEEVILDLDSRGNVSYSYEISYDCPWLICEEKCGRVETDKDGHKSVVFRADRSMINGKTSADAIVKILFDNGKEDVSRLRFIADTAPAADGENVFIEREGYCCILAEHFSEKKDTAEGGFTAIDYLGREYAAVKAFPAMTAYKDTENAPYVRYSFIAENTGTYCVRLYLMSRNPVIKGGEMCFGISANGGTPERINAVSDSFYTEHFCPEWANGVLDKVRPVTVKLALNAGRNDVYIYAGDPGIILEKLVFFPEEKGLAESYLGPCESCRAAQ